MAYLLPAGIKTEAVRPPVSPYWYCKFIPEVRRRKNVQPRRGREAGASSTGSHGERATGNDVNASGADHAAGGSCERMFAGTVNWPAEVFSMQTNALPCTPVPRMGVTLAPTIVSTVEGSPPVHRTVNPPLRLINLKSSGLLVTTRSGTISIAPLTCRHRLRLDP